MDGAFPERSKNWPDGRGKGILIGMPKMSEIRQEKQEEVLLRKNGLVELKDIPAG